MMPGIAINLTPHRRRVERARRRRLATMKIVLPVWAVLVAGASFWAAVFWAHEDDQDLSQQLSDAQARLESSRARDQIARTTLLRDQTALAAARLPADRPDFSGLLAVLAAQRGGDVLYESIELSGGLTFEQPVGSAPAAGSAGGAGGKSAPVQIERYDVVIAGLAESPGSAAALASRLQRSNAFLTVRLTDTQPRDMQGLPLTAFRLECRLGPRATSPQTPPTPTPEPASPARSAPDSVGRGGNGGGAGAGGGGIAAGGGT